MRTFDLRGAQGSVGQQRHWLYNALDCVGTRKVHDTLQTLMSPAAKRYYQFEMAAQTPAMKMASRGILVDTFARDEVVLELKKELKTMAKAISAHPQVEGVWDGTEKETGTCAKSKRKDGKHSWEPGVPDGPDRHCTECGKSRLRPTAFNPASPVGVMHLFYDLLKIRRQYNKDGLPSSDDEAMSRIARQFPKVAELATYVKDYRALNKQIGFLSTSLTPKDRFPSSFNVGAAWTDRWSSSSDVFGYGGNSQNITERHRRMFVADPGKVLVYADLKQAESNIVAHLAGDDAYIEAHQSGDVHTFATRLIWPDLGWTGDLTHDKDLAKGTLPEWDQTPGHDLRWQSKRIQHGSNYGLTPFGMSIISHTPVAANRVAQSSYFKGFPMIRVWQRQVREIVQGQGTLVSPLGREVKLFGRPWDEHTYKQGLAVGPQGTVAHIINMAAWRIENEFDPDKIELLAQVHDALVWQQDPGDLDTLYQAAGLMMIPMPIVDVMGKLRYAVIEAEIAMGKNWGHKSKTNPDGIDEIHIPKEYFPHGF
jgi:DNA polymerase-1